jgi:hypothetical protein
LCIVWITLTSLASPCPVFIATDKHSFILLFVTRQCLIRVRSM